MLHRGTPGAAQGYTEQKEMFKKFLLNRKFIMLRLDNPSYFINISLCNSVIPL